MKIGKNLRIMDRRTFVKQSGIAALGLTALNTNSVFAGQQADKLKVAMIGVGLRGQNHLDLLLRREDVEVVAMCDIDERMLNRARKIVADRGKAMPKIFTGSDMAWKTMLENKGLQAVIISTPWEWHKQMIIDSIAAGIKYVGTEVVLGISLKDHWDVVTAAEKAQAHVMMLENVCYRRDVMAVLNMVRQNVLGELVHLEGGYQHDLREVKFNDGVQPYGGGVEFGEKGFSEARWRTQHSVTRNGDLYPTHGIGPVAHYININRGNRFLRLSSFATKSRGLHNYIVEKGGADHPNAKVNFKLGDIVTTQIACQNGETIYLQHDTNLPRPYSLGFRVQGTKGLWMDINKSIYVEGQSKPHAWDNAKEWLDKYDHPLWKKYGNDAAGAGHGGMDFFVIHAFVEAAKRGAPTPMDVYDAAAWSAITPLSEMSIAKGNKTLDFPDFTKGKWATRQAIFALNDDY